MIWLIIYLIGVIVAFFFTIHIERRIDNITIESTLDILVMSTMSWILVFILLITKLLLYFNINIDEIIIFRKKNKNL